MEPTKGYIIRAIKWRLRHRRHNQQIQRMYNRCVAYANDSVAYWKGLKGERPWENRRGGEKTV